MQKHEKTECPAESLSIYFNLFLSQFWESTRHTYQLILSMISVISFINNDLSVICLFTTKRKERKRLFMYQIGKWFFPFILYIHILFMDDKHHYGPSLMLNSKLEVSAQELALTQRWHLFDLFLLLCSTSIISHFWSQMFNKYTIMSHLGGASRLLWLLQWPQFSASRHFGIWLYMHISALPFVFAMNYEGTLLLVIMCIKHKLARPGHQV